MRMWKNATRLNVFDDIKKSEQNIVACFDLLGTRMRINKLETKKELGNLALELRKIVDENVETSVEKAIKKYNKTVAKGIFFSFKKKSPDFKREIKQILIQDTIIVIFDIQKLIKKGMFVIDIELLTFFEFVLEFCREFANSLLYAGYLFRGALSAGTLHHTNRIILGTAFVDAYDHVEGEKKENIVGVQVSSSFLKFQNFINEIVPHVHCSYGEFLRYNQYIKINNAVFLNPDIGNLFKYQLYLKQLQTNNCKDKFYIDTANLLGESLRISPSGEKDESIIEQFKHYEFPID